MTLINYTRYRLLLLVIVSSFLFLAFSVKSFSQHLEFVQLFGLLSLQILWWQIILGNRFLTRWVTPDLQKINRLHKFFGKYGFILVVIHVLGAVNVYSLDLLNPDLDSSFGVAVFIGQVAFDLLILTWVMSAFVRKQISWRNWKRIHLLAYLVLPMAMYHSGQIGGDITTGGTYQFWHSFIVLSFGVVVAVRLLSWAGLLKKKYRVVGVEEVTHNIRKISLKPVKGQPIRPKWGQFSYLQINRFGESHPFTISHFDERTDTISHSVKAVGPFSKTTHILNVGDKVFVDGPYGVFTDEVRDTVKPVIAIAGGIGITPFITWIKKGSIDYLFFGNKTKNDIPFLKDIARSRVDSTHVLSREKIRVYEHGRVSVDKIKKHVDESLPAYQYFICGPPAMTDKIIDQLIENKVPKEQIHTEKFSI